MDHYTTGTKVAAIPFILFAVMAIGGFIDWMRGYGGLAPNQTATTQAAP